MAPTEFTCESCGRRFTLPAETLARYPNWTPRQCMTCRDRARGGARGASAGGGAAGGRGASGGRGGPGSRGGRARNGARAGTQSTADVLNRYHEGPQTGVFTDGSSSGNPGPGGWGVVWVRDGEILDERWGDEPHTTNNRMELLAIINALEMIPPDEDIDVYTDSRLVVDTLTKWAAGWERAGWKRRDGEVKNLELVQEAYALAQARPRARIQWIRAHDGSRWNEYADSLATAYLREEV